MIAYRLRNRSGLAGINCLCMRFFMIAFIMKKDKTNLKIERSISWINWSQENGKNWMRLSVVPHWLQMNSNLKNLKEFLNSLIPRSIANNANTFSINLHSLKKISFHFNSSNSILIEFLKWGTVHHSKK